MDQEEQQQALYDDLWRLKDRYMKEFGLTFSSLIGTIELFKLEVWAIHTTNSNVSNDQEEDEKEGDWPEG